MHGKKLVEANPRVNIVKVNQFIFVISIPRKIYIYEIHHDVLVFTFLFLLAERSDKNVIRLSQMILKRHRIWITILFEAVAER